MNYFCASLCVFAFCLFFWIPAAQGRKVVPGSVPCEKDADCLGIGKCNKDNNRCFCDTVPCPIVSFRGASSFSQSIQSIQCNETSPCPEKFSCTNGLCVCEGNYVPSTNTTDCLEVKHRYGDECKESVQCKLENTKCEKNHCVCVEGYRSVDNTTCNQIGGLGSRKCDQLEDCKDLEGALCDTKTGTCNCESSKLATKDGTKCVEPVKPGETCDENSVCQGKNVTCINTTCQCTDTNQHFGEKQNQCIPTKHLGELCTDPDDCYLFDSEHQMNALTCDKNCTCAKSYILTGNENNQTCTYSGTVAVTINCLLISFALYLSVIKIV